MNEEFDVIVIGGGATGLGVAVEAASRGYKTILLEAYDFGKGTSAKSTKLVHGGIRYLANLDFALVREGLSERFYFLQNAPHIAHAQEYLVPFYSFWDRITYFFGIKLYDLLARQKKIGKSRFFNRNQTLIAAPDLAANNLRGSASYYDGQFDDTRMLITLLKTFQDLGGVAYNYHEVTGFIKNHTNKITGVTVVDKLNDSDHQCTTSSAEFIINAKVIINATGTLTDTLLDINEPTQKHSHVEAAQGTHLVFERDVFASEYALVIPKTTDDRILFVLPWHNKVIVGTTDIAVATPSIEPKATIEEIDFILETLNQITKRKITKSEIKSVFAGQRPLVKPANQMSSAKISRKHEILYSNNGLISIVGGKWTIYRLMGEDTINFAISKNLLHPSKSISKNLHLFGYTKEQLDYPLSVYGVEAQKILIIQKEIGNRALLHPNLPYFQAEVIYQVRHEMAKTVEDILVRRTRAIFLDAKATIEAAPLVAKLMAHELDKNKEWINRQIREFNLIANNYLYNQ